MDTTHGTLNVPERVLNDIQIFAEGPNGGDMYLEHLRCARKQPRHRQQWHVRSRDHGWYTYIGVASSTTAPRTAYASLLLGNRTATLPAVTDLSK